MATDDDDAATLRERVRELEQTVAQQQDTIEQLMPSRRAVLAGGAGLVGGAALTGQASAQSAAGQVGTSSEPVDVEAAEVNADSVNTDLTSIGGHGDISGLETGQESNSGPPASADNNWDTRQTVSVSITFGTEFASTPKVVHDQPPERGVIFAVENVTTTGFDWLIGNYDILDRSNDTFQTDWVAIS